MAFKTRQKTAEKSRKFDYRPRTSDQVSKRATQTGWSKEGFVKSEFSAWTPNDGENRIRILPPATPEGYPPDGHFGMEIWAHYQIGPDRSSFLCLAKHEDTACPICEERQALFDSGEEDQARAFQSRKRVAMWIIDRKQESKGPMLWCAPWTLDQEIAQQSTGENGEALAIDNPFEGYDVLFTREEQKGGMPKYVGVKVARRSSPIFDDEDEVNDTLKFVVANPVPDVLEFSDYEHVKKVFAGGEKDEDEKPKRKTKPKDEDEDEKPSRRPSTKGKAKEEEEDGDPDHPDEHDLPTWDEVHAMSEDEVGEFGEEKGVDFGDQEFEDLKEVQDFVCEALDIEKPSKPAKRPLVGKKANSGKPVIGKRSTKDEDEDEDEDKDDKPAAKPGRTADWRSKLQKFKER